MTDIFEAWWMEGEGSMLAVTPANSRWEQRHIDFINDHQPITNSSPAYLTSELKVFDNLMPAWTMMIQMGKEWDREHYH